MALDTERALLKHFLAAIAYRTQKALRDAPAVYPAFSAGHDTRTPVEILRHMTSVLGYSRTMFLGGSYPFRPQPVAPENFIYAQIDANRLGPDQPLPARPDAEWPERPRSS